MDWRLRIGLIGVGLLAPTASLPAVAGAATLSVSGTTITLQALPGESNFATVNWGNGTFGFPPTISENRVDIVPEPGCEEPTLGSFSCPSAGQRPTFVLRLGDGDDIAQSINSGAAGTTTQMFGEAGNDRLQSQLGSDLLDGGPGDDDLQPDDGESSPGDVLSGGEGTDLLQLISSPGPAVTATLDGVADDGGPGQADNYAPDFENITGSRAANTIVGTPGPNVILGADQADVLSGLGGDDRIEGRDANDRIDGGDGADRLIGDSGDDLIIGGGGVDSIDGDGIGAFGQVVAGNDRIEARDGLAESINCGLASDTAIIDAVDTVPADPTTACEIVDRGTAPPPPTAGKVAIRSTSVRYRDGRVGLALTCPTTVSTCRGTLRLRTVSRVRVGRTRKLVTVVSTRYSLAKGQRRTVRLRPGSSGRSLLRRVRVLRVRVELLPTGTKTPITKTLTLRR